MHNFMFYILHYTVVKGITSIIFPWANQLKTSDSL